MTKAIHIMFIIILANQSNGQVIDSLPVTKQEVKAFFGDTWQVINRGKPYFYINDKPSDIGLPSSKKELNKYLKDWKFDSFFVKSDVDFLVKQIKETKEIIWDSSYIDSAKFLNHSFIDSSFHSPIDSIRRGYGLPIHYYLTFPIFSKDKMTCYISTWFWCGRLCGHGQSFIFKFINNHWEQYRIFYGPVS